MNFLLSLLNRELSNFHIKEALAASLWHRRTASIITLAWGLLLLNKMRGTWMQAHDALIVDLIITMATKWLVDGTLGQRMMIRVLGRMEQDGVRFHLTSQNNFHNLKAYESFASGIFHWIFLDLSWPRVTETVGSKTAGKEGTIVYIKKILKQRK